MAHPLLAIIDFPMVGGGNHTTVDGIEFQNCIMGGCHPPSTSGRLPRRNGSLPMAPLHGRFISRRISLVFFETRKRRKHLDSLVERNSRRMGGHTSLEGNEGGRVSATLSPSPLAAPICLSHHARCLVEFPTPFDVYGGVHHDCANHEFALSLVFCGAIAALAMVFDSAPRP